MPRPGTTSSATSSPPCRSRSAASSHGGPLRRPQHPARPGPAGVLRARAGRGPQRPEHGCPAVGLPHRRPGLVARAVRRGRAGRDVSADSWRSSPSWCSPTSTSSPPPASPVTPTSSPPRSAARSACSSGSPWTCCAAPPRRSAPAAPSAPTGTLPRTITVLLVPDDRSCTRPARWSTRAPWSLGEDLPDLATSEDYVAPAGARPAPPARRRLLRSLRDYGGVLGPDQAVAADGLLLPTRPAGRAPGGLRGRQPAPRHTTPTHTWPSWC